MATTRSHSKKNVRRLAIRQPCVHGKIGVVLEPYQVIIRPVVSEKGTHQSSRYNAYSFIVHPQSTKDQIKAAIQSLFNVRVEAVRTQVRHGKKTRHKNKMGNRPDWKKALVELNAEDKIEFF